MPADIGLESFKLLQLQAFRSPGQRGVTSFQVLIRGLRTLDLGPKLVDSKSLDFYMRFPARQRLWVEDLKPEIDVNIAHWLEPKPTCF